jgi:hypothetical protein
MTTKEKREEENKHTHILSFFEENRRGFPYCTFINRKRELYKTYVQKSFTGMTSKMLEKPVSLAWLYAYKAEKDHEIHLAIYSGKPEHY